MKHLRIQHSKSHIKKIRLSVILIIIGITVGISSAGALESSVERFVTANGLNIRYHEQGTGTPLILLHGGGLTSKMWEAFIPYAAKHFRVLAPDTRGHGLTNNPDGKFSYQLLAEDTIAFAEALKIEKPIICGYSDGGITAVTVAKNHPSFPRAIVTCGAAPVSENLTHYIAGLKLFFAIEVNNTLSDKDLDTIASERPEMVKKYQFLHQQNNDPQYWRTLMKTVWPQWASPGFYNAQDISQITVPTLILLGDRDEFFQVEDAVKLLRMLPDGYLAIGPGASHTFFRDKPELFHSLLFDFLLNKAISNENSNSINENGRSL
ncbi:MAG: alpha/beta hydrolase [Candidatus Riflebacteria bacterium]|nr:alpha/beta hydrolase [Candidatus Riflebacteria bacterium]